MRPLDVKALVRPPFTDKDFTATKFDTPADKAWFANALCKFIASDYKQSLWTKRLYNRLSNCFGHIAHHSDAGFSSEFFTSTQGKINFIKQTMSHPCYGDPAHTYGDVERAIRTRLRSCGRPFTPGSSPAVPPRSTVPSPPSPPADQTPDPACPGADAGSAPRCCLA